MMQIKHLVRHPNGDKVSASEKGLLMQIADDHNEDRAYAWPSIPALSRRSGLSMNQSRRLIQRMVTIGTLEARPTVNAHSGARQSNEYRFWFDRPFDRRKGRYAEQTIKMQEMRAASRPKQLSLDEAQVTGHAAHAELAANEPNDGLFFAQAMGGDGTADGSVPPTVDGSVPLPLVGVAPSHQWEGFNTSTTPDQHKVSAQDIPPAALPRVESTVVGDRDAMPFQNLRMNDAKFQQELGRASTWLRERLRISDPKMERTLAAAMALFCKVERQGLQSAASLARQNWQEYQRLEAAGHLRVQYGAPKFFAHQHWMRPQSWALTEEGRRAASATTGTYRPAP